MAVTLQQAANYVGASEEDEFLILFFNAAPELIKDYLRGGKVHPYVFDSAHLQLVSELWIRRNNPGGMVQYAEGIPARLARDAMLSVAPLLMSKRGLGTPG
ncbi:hypothetical protein [Lentzea terrae]|uniref:hypothetical protein n=1 Tax=Lentzea terrae TaxID=2200761 RepID=UPI0013006495|nr:hypothetical protein [Lentzea terrae]